MEFAEEVDDPGRRERVFPVSGRPLRLRLRADGRRLTLRSRGPVARWVFPLLNTLPVLTLLPGLALAVAAPLLGPPPGSSGGSVWFAAFVLGVAAVPIPLLLWGLLFALGVGRGLRVVLDADAGGCAVRRSRCGWLPVTRRCGLEDAELGLAVTQPGDGEHGAPARRRVGALAVGLALLSLVNPLFLIVSLLAGGRAAASPAAAPAGWLRVAGRGPDGWCFLVPLSELAGPARAAAAFASAERERFRMGFDAEA